MSSHPPLKSFASAHLELPTYTKKVVSFLGSNNSSIKLGLAPPSLIVSKERAQSGDPYSSYLCAGKMYTGVTPKLYTAYNDNQCTGSR